MEIDRLTAEEEQAGLERDYERAANKKAERLRLESDFNARRDQWETEHQLDGKVDEDDIAQVIAQWTGMPVSQMMESESMKLLQMEERLHERIIGQEEAITRHLGRNPPGAVGSERPTPPHWLLYLYWPFGRRQNRAGQSAG